MVFEFGILDAPIIMVGVPSQPDHFFNSPRRSMLSSDALHVPDGAFERDAFADEEVERQIIETLMRGHAWNGDFFDRHAELGDRLRDADAARFACFGEELQLLPVVTAAAGRWLTSVATGSVEARMQPHQRGRFAMGPSPSPAISASTTHRWGRRDGHEVHEPGEHLRIAVVELAPFGLTAPTQIFRAPEIGSMWWFLALGQSMMTSASSSGAGSGRFG